MTNTWKYKREMHIKDKMDNKYSTSGRASLTSNKRTRYFSRSKGIGYERKDSPKIEEVRKYP